MSRSQTAAAGIAVVTGASRGVGRGVAEALGAAGMTVYVTGRSTADGASRIGETPLHGTIHDAAAAVTAAGGQASRCIATMATTLR
jgi:NAD(P)-dependent dehydrogenase (short-subunit alcohol dehydrogenase family)